MGKKTKKTFIRVLMGEGWGRRRMLKDKKLTSFLKLFDFGSTLKQKQAVSLQSHYCPHCSWETSHHWYPFVYRAR